ncbi:MAG: carboxypeptidase M32 [Thermoleophilia bacterium]|nr:carboxypeptidase M32 [Thermoleophilia bacterium]MDH3724227.1 carboxypeptidase M32 [Thermoleophilia bacterium]
MGGGPFPTGAEWQALLEWTGTLADLSGTSTVLGWDRETIMPAGGGEGRAKLLGTMAALSHRELMRPDGDELLDSASASATTPAHDRVIALMRRERDRASRVPESLVRELSEASSRCVSTWIETRPRDDFATFAAALSPLVELKRRQADALDIGDEPYDGLLDQFEPGARAAQLEVLFRDLAAGIQSLLDRVDDDAAALPERTWPVDAQMTLASDIADLVGFERETGALAQSAHPFTCSPHSGDVRFTTRVDSSDPMGNILAVMHEAGHALYEQGFPQEFARTPLRDAPSLGAHESQSRFWENHVGRTHAFWTHLAPTLRRLFPDAMRGVSEDDLRRGATRVHPSFIRVESDEVTYNLHIGLRFELELAMIRGDLEVADLPVAWGDRLEQLLGIRPAADGEGCMQDIHWPEGMFGYFPTYTLGNLYAAQLDAALHDHLGPTAPLIERGELAPLLSFMRDRIHTQGNLRDAEALMADATGQPLDAGPFLAHLERSYVG